MARQDYRPTQQPEPNTAPIENVANPNDPWTKPVNDSEHYRLATVCGLFGASRPSIDEEYLELAMESRPLNAPNVALLLGVLRRTGMAASDLGRTASAWLEARGVDTAVPLPPDPRDPGFEPNLEERAQRIITAGLMAWDTNPCTEHLRILQTAFPEWSVTDYPRLTVALWFAIKDWKWLRLQQAGISETTSMMEVTKFDTSTLGEIYAAVTRIQTATVKFIHLHKVAVAQDPRFNDRAELRVRML